jgi:ribosomal-protein-serine acetyltransferase
VNFRRIIAPGIEIRQMQPSDADEIYPVVDRNRRHLRPWLPWVQHTHGVDDIRAFIHSVAGKCAIGDELHCAIWVDGEVGGAIGHHALDWANRSAALGYWIDAAHQGRGIVTRCCHAMLDYLFDERGLHRVEIRCATGNVRSCAIPQRLGFRREGVIRHGELGADGWLDLVVWGILEHEWRKA